MRGVARCVTRDEERKKAGRRAKNEKSSNKSKTDRSSRGAEVEVTAALRPWGISSVELGAQSAGKSLAWLATGRPGRTEPM